jgi:rRNA processing/ribosome biogenesis
MVMMQTLESIVQLQLATEATSVFHLPAVLGSLTEEHFHSRELPSSNAPHSPYSGSAGSTGRTKWIARVNSLLHSKEPAGRWVGACLARRTATVSKDVLFECASGWIGVVLPWFSVRPTHPDLSYFIA